MRLHDIFSFRPTGTKGFLRDVAKMSRLVSGTNDRLISIDGTLVSIDVEVDLDDPSGIAINVIETLRGRRQGAASAVMRQLTALADKNQVVLYLYADIMPKHINRRDLPRSQQLKKWYSKFGFEFNGYEGKRVPVPVLSSQ